MNKFAKPALLLATIIWGSSFFIMKNTIDEIPAPYLLALRFAAAALFLSLVFVKKWKHLTKEYVWQGAIIGICLYLGYLAQTAGLKTTTPGKNAFLTATYCIFVPLVHWLIDRQRPAVHNLLASLICVSGIGLISMQGSVSIGAGDAFSLLCGFLYAIHIVLLGRYSKHKDVILVTILQFIFCAICAGLHSLLAHPVVTWEFSGGFWWGMLYLTFGATVVSMLLQTLGQKYTSPSVSALILSLESVFGVFFSVLFYGEKLNAQLILGFLLVFVSIVFSELSDMKKRPLGLSEAEQEKAA